jgi:hypothetical protein
MSDWPATPLYPLVTITPFALEANQYRVSNSTNPSVAVSTAWPTANLALYFPFWLSIPVTIVKMFTVNGATASNNIDVGIYDSAGARLVSIGTTALAGTNAIQEYNITDTQIGPGKFFLAIAMNGTAGTLSMINTPPAPLQRGGGRFEQATAFVLPATATFAAASTTALTPLFGATIRTVV